MISAAACAFAFFVASNSISAGTSAIARNQLMRRRTSSLKTAAVVPGSHPATLPVHAIFEFPLVEAL